MSKAYVPIYIRCNLIYDFRTHNDVYSIDMAYLNYDDNLIDFETLYVWTNPFKSLKDNHIVILLSIWSKYVFLYFSCVLVTVIM